MATKAHRRRQHRRRLFRLLRTISRQWLLVLLSHTLATIVLLVVARWFHLPGCGGE